MFFAGGTVRAGIRPVPGGTGLGQHLGGGYWPVSASVGGFFPFVGTNFAPRFRFARTLRPDVLSYLNDRDSEAVSNVTCAARGLRTVWIATGRQPRPQNPRCSRASGVLFQSRQRN